MKIYGSMASPYVRRLRILLANTEHELVVVNLFGKERAELKKVNPTLKIPMFEDTAKPETPMLFDSGLIYRYLVDTYDFPSLTLAEQNLLVAIDACSDSLVNMLIMTRSDIDTNEDKLYFKVQRERQKVTFDLLEQELINGNFTKWNYLTISLVVLVEWAQFRNLYDFSSYPNICEFVAISQDQDGVAATKPQD